LHGARAAAGVRDALGAGAVPGERADEAAGGAEVRFGADCTRYDRTLGRHDHAICNKCGKLVDLDLPVDAAMLKRASKLSKFKAESIELILRGLCSECSLTA
jgi:Fe2+ or Zn2+ uptake regulation protein